MTRATRIPANRTARPYRAGDDLDGFDAIVIGSGLGSLAAAAILARRAQQRVLVLERHYTPGGFTHVFRRPGCEWDVGLHYVGDIDRPNAGLAPLLRYVAGEDLEWTPMDPAYDRMICQGESFDLVAGRAAFIDSLARQFPSEASVIGRYVDRLDECHVASRRFFAEKALPGPLAATLGRWLRRPFLRFARQTTFNVLSDLGASKKLMGVLSTQWGDYGLPPRVSSFGIHAIVARHYLRGAAYPVGGASGIAAAIGKTIETAGGQILIRAEVSAIVLENGRAVGVRLADGRVVRAPTVISGAGARQTFGRLLSREVADGLGWTTRLDQIGPSSAMLCLFIALEGTDAELGLRSTNLWIHPTFDHDANLARYRARPDEPFPVVYLSFQSAKDPVFAARYPGTAAVQVIAPADYSWFQNWECADWKRRGVEYDELKASFTERLLDHLYQHAPKTKGRVRLAELGTPLSTRHFANHPNGETYGLAHTPLRFETRALRPRTGIPGLFLTGVDVAVCGIGGALASGYLAASCVLGRNALAFARSGDREMMRKWKL